MDAIPSKQTIFPAAWGQVLENVQRALEQAEAQAAEREKTLALQGPKAESASAREATWQQGLSRMAERVKIWHQGTQEVEKRVWEVDARLQACEEALQSWANDLQTNGQDLANWAKH